MTNCKNEHEIPRVKDEISTLMTGDVPYYMFDYYSRDLYSGNGLVSKNYFTYSAREICIERMNHLEEFMKPNIGLIQKSLLTAYVNKPEVENTIVYKCCRKSSNYIENITPHSITDLEVNDYVLRVIRVHINVYVENVDLIRRLNQRQESIKKYDVFNREIKKCRKELEKVAVHRERLFEDYVCRIIDAEQYETFSKQDAETEKEIQNNMEILLKHQVGYEKNFHTEEEWETLINKYRNTRTLTKEMVNAFVEKIEIHESGSITVRLVYDDMLEELRKYAKEREAELCQ